MSKTYTPPGGNQGLDLDPARVAEFFEARANRLPQLGALHAVIYQEKQGDLATRRDQAEVECVLPLLLLDGQQRLLDVGCGTGRWTARIAPLTAVYHGIDFSNGLLAHAREAFGDLPNCRFTRLGADSISADALPGENFDRVLCAGVSIYLNDDQLLNMFAGIQAVAARGCRVVLREPVGLDSRLTLQEHWSDELEHSYNAIYRTESELLDATQASLLSNGFRHSGSGDVYEEASLNNRPDTRQRWILLERDA